MDWQGRWDELIARDEGHSKEIWRLYERQTSGTAVTRDEVEIRMNLVQRCMGEKSDLMMEELFLRVQQKRLDLVGEMKQKMQAVDATEKALYVGFWELFESAWEERAKSLEGPDSVPADSRSDEAGRQTACR